MRLGEVEAWVRWRDERAVIACAESPDKIPGWLIFYPASVMPDLPRAPSEREDGFPQPVPRTTEEQRRPTVDEALRNGQLIAYRVVDDGRRRVDVAHWRFSSVGKNGSLVFDAREVRHIWPPLQNDVAPPLRRRGRRKGVGSYESQDAPLVEEMQRMIEAGEKLSAYAAATALVERAFGGGTDEAKCKRLVDRYHRTYGRD